MIGVSGEKGSTRVLHEKEFEVLAVGVDRYISCKYNLFYI